MQDRPPHKCVPACVPGRCVPRVRLYRTVAALASTWPLLNHADLPDDIDALKALLLAAEQTLRERDRRKQRGCGPTCVTIAHRATGHRRRFGSPTRRTARASIHKLTWPTSAACCRLMPMPVSSKRSTNPSLFSPADHWLNQGYASPSHSTAAAPRRPPRFSRRAGRAARAAATCKVPPRSPWPFPAPSR